MASTSASLILEQARSLHEELERQEQLLIQTISHPPHHNQDTNDKEAKNDQNFENNKNNSSSPPNSLPLPLSLRNLTYYHSIQHQLANYIKTSSQLQLLYADEDHSYETQLKELTGDKMWNHFDQAVSQLKTQYSTSENQQNPFSFTTSTAVPAPSVRELFNSTEQFGQMLDFTSHYNVYLNLPQFIRYDTSSASSSSALSSAIRLPPYDYITYLSHLSTHFNSITVESKFNSTAAAATLYHDYVRGIQLYLEEYHAKLYPLVSQSKLKEMMKDEFEEKWKRKTVEGWFDRDERGGGGEKRKREESNQNGGGVDGVGMMDTSSDTVDQNSNSLYCEACQKTFAKDTVFQGHLKGKKHIKAAAALGGSSSSASSSLSSSSSSSSNGSSSSSSSTFDSCFALALLEFTTLHYLSLLSPLLVNTISFLEKTQTKTYDELQNESILREQEYELEELKIKQLANRAWEPLTEEEQSAAAADDDDDSDNSNPLNLPLGWDGKPIPYWLYKLHGLNISYSCQICGNYVYRGPRAYERHFNEWRHNYGLKCLGIENRKELLWITKIEDAERLWEKIKARGGKRETVDGGAGAGKFVADEDEEVEDKDGNVFNKKTYIQLLKQGIIES